MTIKKAHVQPKKKHKRKINKKNLITMIVSIIVVLCIIVGSIGLVVMANMLQGKPDLVVENFVSPESSRIYDANGELIADVGSQIRTNISYDEIKYKIFSADIIYVGGGDTTFMLKIWKELGVDKLLYEAYNKGIVLSGISAGAICWFEYYDNMDDIENIEQLDIVPGLSFVKGFGVPHYNWLTPDEKKKINDRLKDKNIKGWSIDDCVAIVFQNDELKIISCRSDRTATQIP